MIFSRPKIAGILVLICACVFYCWSCWNAVAKYPDGFYSNNLNQLEDIIARADIENFNVWPHGIERNSTGTSLKISDADAKEKIVISCDGSMQRISLPSSNSWLNDKNEIVAWQISDKVYYKCGSSEKGELVPYHGTDPSGKYFYKRIGNAKLGVFKISEPLKPLLELDGLRLRLFSNDKELHVFAMKKSRDIIYGYIFEIEENRLKNNNEFNITRKNSGASPFWIVDYNINTGDAVVVDVWDKPFKSKWYLYNIYQNKFSKLGKASDFGFFMKCDIVNMALSNLE